MMRRRQRKCSNCGQLYFPDPCNTYHQRYCSVAKCRAASKQRSQRRWRRSALGRDYFKGSANFDRVRKWRKDNPGYWRRRRKNAVALQDLLFPQTHSSQGNKPILNEAHGALDKQPPKEFSYEKPVFEAIQPHALQDFLSTQFSLQLGLIDQLNGGLQDDIVPLISRLILRGQQLQGHWPGAIKSHERGQTGAVPTAAAESAAAVQLDRSTPGSG